MPCLFALFAVFTPRLATVFLWLARPVMFSSAFGSWVWPLLGIIFLPFTTLMYVILYTPAVGLTTWDWIWLILAFVCDVMHYSTTGYYNRDRIPGYNPPPGGPQPM